MRRQDRSPVTLMREGISRREEQIDSGEFRVRLQHIEECIHRLENELIALKASHGVSEPRLAQLEKDLRNAEKELSALQGQGQAHGVRLDNIDRSMVALKEEIMAFHRTLKEEIGANRGLLQTHTATEEMWQRKIHWSLFTMLVGIVSTMAMLIVGFLLRQHGG